MPNSPATASSPTGSAGEQGGLARAFDAAVAELDIDEAGFAPAAMEPTPEVTDEQPVDETASEPAPEAKPKAPVKTKAKEGKPVSTEPTAQPSLAAPANWDANRKAAFDKLGAPEAKQAMLDMAKGLESDYTKKSTELANEARYAQAVRSLVTDEHRRQMAAGGFKSEVEGIAHLVKLNDWATKDFPGYVRWAVEQFSQGNPAAALRQIFPDAFTGSTEGQPGAQPAPQPAIDPRIKQAYDPILRQIMAEVQGLKQGSQQAQERAADRVIANFRDETDEAGQAKRPHFAQVEQRMIGLLQTPGFQNIEDMGERLQQAYDAAVALDPTIRKQVIDSEAQRRADELRKADEVARARRARAPIKATPSGPATKPMKGLDGALKQAMDLHGI